MGFHAKKRFGQNFLIDNTIIDRIVDSVEVINNEKILEIGPGKGYLTKELKSFNKDLFCFEIDEDTTKYLLPLQDDKTHIIYSDFLSINLNDYFSNNDIIHVIANIPYYITTPIIEHLIDSKLNIKDMTLMVQKEVAERLCAKPRTKDYGYITVYLNYYYEINKIIDVPRKAFDPIPNVDSAVIQLNKRINKYNLKNEELFFNLIKDAFKMKRKNLRNNLKNYDLDKILEVLQDNNLDLNNRAEEVPIEVFISIANNI